jgi:hypothetical protein
MTKPLSKNAQKLLARVRAGAWYEAYSEKTPKAMQELIDAELVGMCGRIRQMVLCYVPVGYIPPVEEKYPEEKPE